MTIKTKKNKLHRKIEIDLSGPQGNAFFLLKLATDWGRQIGYDEDHIERILNEMKLTDYEGLLHTFDREFGDFVILWR